MNFDDYNAIVRRRYEYALGIDTRDWGLFRNIFTDEITVDFSSYNGQPVAKMAADAWVRGCEVLFTGLDATQHVMSNPMVDIDGKRARCRMYMKAEHFLINDQGNDDFTLGGYYYDQLVKTTEGWKIEAVTLNVFWNRGNRHIMDLATEIGRKRLSAE
ncbi:MAG: nuclear transport factor 2 family protein [Kiritimatiellia bacterium]|jgi:hypothetical protein|nr:nuclear transport factor 2 family protein [Pseudomonadales bacterium]MDP6473246.1 nuclear transport factor 2 family protein [Pseudomonadales bacterium]MDP6829171.1 nuclear transport factor 2 family protein [Pseudomonadales bacterium]MDP7024718.1 nuclear transport factor 2 family protein [Kiritimatiellia bacterium]|tara:strand:- start:1893 stop:2366 length:474 start_codon:yes stop_codon:yes gene_type:complete